MLPFPPSPSPMVAAIRLKIRMAGRRRKADAVVDHKFMRSSSMFAQVGQSIIIGLGKTYMGQRDSGNYGLQSYNDNFEAVNHVFSLSVAYLMDIDVRAYLQKGRIRR